MLTATRRSASVPSPLLNFALPALAWSLALFGGMRLAVVEAHLLHPLTQWQARLAEWVFGAAPFPVSVTLACSGADALALCAAAVLAYPASWRARAIGVSLGVGLVLTLNTGRIASLGRAAGSPALFETLHLYVWPGVVTVAIAAYVFTWMRVADEQPPGPPTALQRPVPLPVDKPRARRLSTFLWVSAACIALFVAGAPLYRDSAAVRAAASLIARAAAGTLRSVGLHAESTIDVLWTAHGGFLVTPDCILTPLIPVYCAAILTYARPRPMAMLGLLTAVPLFIALGIARLLVVALPATLGASPLAMVHAFYQVLVAVVVIVGAAHWREGAGHRAWSRAALAGGAGLVLALIVAPLYAYTIAAAAVSGLHLDDPQGAVAFLPAFQVGVFAALSVTVLSPGRWRRAFAGLAVLLASQLVVFVLLDFAARSLGLVPHVRDVRAWALAGPILVVVAMVAHARPRR